MYWIFNLNRGFQLQLFVMVSLVESKGPVAECNPKWSDSPEAPETSMMFLRPFKHLLMRSVAEWCIRWHFAVAKLVITWLVHVKTNWSTSSKNPLALTITEWVNLWMSATTPIVWFATTQENMSWENTGVCWHAGRSIFTLFVRSWFC